MESGATAVVAVVSRDGWVVVANAGDSRAVLCRANGRAVDLSVDHKPTDAGERARIEAAGGTVTHGRVAGNLNLSRAVGDLLYKRNLAVAVEAQMISALPDVNAVPLSAGDRFLVLCCDGIWNVLSSQDVVDFVAERLNRNPPPSLGTVCEDLMAECLAADTEGDGAGCDNMTALVVLLPGAEADAAHAALAGGAAAAAAVAAAAAAAEDAEDAADDAADDAAACALTKEEAAAAAPAGTSAAGEAAVATAAGAAAAAAGQKRPADAVAAPRASQRTRGP